MNPFFSIIIPSYKPAYLDKLLDSIIKQYMRKDIEVIIVDDCSKGISENNWERIVWYRDYLGKYMSKLNIKFLSTDYNNSCPGNTREKGVSVATGDWIVFADDDDLFIPGTLRKIKKAIIKNNEKYLAIANYNEINPNNGNIINQIVKSENCIYAKFYNRENLWNKYNIHFRKDMKSHEDMYIASQINCIFKDAELEPLFVNLYCYNWNHRNNSLLRNRNYLELSFIDYIESTANVYIKYYDNGDISDIYCIDNLINILVYSYFCIQYFKFNNPNTWNRDNQTACKKLYKYLENELDVDVTFIMNYIKADNCSIISRTRSYVESITNTILYTDTIEQWLRIIRR